MINLDLLKLQAGIQDNPDQEGLDLFADLIIKECAHVALMSNGNNLHVCDLIKKHFGVRE